MILEIILTVELDETFIDEKDPIQQDWLRNTVLSKEELRLHSNEIGDEVGEILNVFVVPKDIR